ncbi:protein RodZ, contains Xre-like HTH and DUF4115 domains [Amphibacillus marinus]|uniref:Protein RodZ, contains Xre-like HTH and DUF4115 domains n=1 Tax=Amphibacillus marinus TaxID=872970 RepID=A0A1H8NP77_9BACI|nr:RodZ domain-containing protein [Amphibacillus marinus]SEO31369.1 protein RodZ, contains Xre-like HTH and DUF4115 domains [Amphibacillus marinus]
MQIGEKLKEARLEKGLTLDDVQRLTKIQTRHLVAIEKNEFSIIPGSFYVRAFIKEYAAVLDLDAQELLQEHAGELPAPDQENTIEYSRMQRTRGQSSSSKTSPLASLLPTIFVVILILGVLFFIYRVALMPSETDNGSNNGQGQTENSPDEVSLPPDEGNEGDNNEEEEEPDPDSEDLEQADLDEDSIEQLSFENNESTFLFETDQEEIVLTVDTTGSNWLEIEDASGERLFYETLQASTAPQTFVISDEAFVYLRFGEPGTISLAINDLDIELSSEIAPTAVQRLWIYINDAPQ